MVQSGVLVIRKTQHCIIVFCVFGFVHFYVESPILVFSTVRLEQKILYQWILLLNPFCCCET